ncbi:hypothetical protein QFC22_001180 [Naganishia vaughanmartiniae]|uniref:Uncharacterized protein n=1 Tax=Naganishia vaughanmartiniae TaxID=1424756 RepID=A0ACC2XLW9_9TREE|nr:hypothetical protein QFC22_001180 [Naganishia vaughanmartiniae]
MVLPTQYQPYQPDQQQQQQQHSTYSNTYGNTNTRPDVELFQINSSSITTTTRRRYPLSPFPEQEVDSRTVSGSATPLPPYAVYPQSQPSSSFQAPPPQQQQQHVQTERQHGFHLAGDVKIPASTSSGAHSSPPPTLTPPTAMTANNAETPKGEEYHVLPSSSSHNNNNNNNNNHRSSTNSRTHNPNINPNDPKPPHHHHHHHGKNKNSTGTGTWTGTGTCAGIVLGGMTMPNAQEYASIPSYGASSSLTSDDSSYYSSSNSESEDSDSAPEADEAGSGRQVDSARERRERERDREGRPSGPEWEANEEDQRRQRQWERERHDSFPSLHSQLDDDDAHRQQAQQTDLQAQSQPTSQPAVSQLERAGSIAAASIHSFKAGDEVGLLASNPAEREQQAKLNETAGLLGKEQASDAVLGVSAGEDRGKRTLSTVSLPREYCTTR